jgi:hypothetical protein
MASLAMQVKWDGCAIPLAQAGGVRGHASHLVLATALAGKGIAYATLSGVHGRGSRAS